MLTVKIAIISSFFAFSSVGIATQPADTDEIEAFQPTLLEIKPLLELAAGPEYHHKIKIEELEAKYGGFHAGLTEELLALGSIYREQQKHQLAYDAFKRSLQIHRINSGLYDIEQFPIVSQLILTSHELSKWEDVDMYIDYLYWLHKRVFVTDSIDILPIVDAVIIWKTDAINLRLVSYRDRMIQELLSAVREHNRIIKQNPGVERGRLDLRARDNVLELVSL